MPICCYISLSHIRHFQYKIIIKTQYDTQLLPFFYDLDINNGKWFFLLI